ncbi:hypothetical protein LXL04_027732 [Taraxacum kok-saghyz]
MIYENEGWTLGKHITLYDGVILNKILSFLVFELHGKGGLCNVMSQLELLYFENGRPTEEFDSDQGMTEIVKNLKIEVKWRLGEEEAAGELGI